MIDLDAVRMRYEIYVHHWPQPPTGAAITASERLIVAKRSANDVPALLARIEDLEHELRLARQHLNVCPTAVAVAEEDAAKRRAG